MVGASGVYSGGALIHSMSLLEVIGADCSSRRCWCRSSLFDVASMLMYERNVGIAAGVMYLLIVTRSSI